MPITPQQIQAAEATQRAAATTVRSRLDWLLIPELGNLFQSKNLCVLASWPGSVAEEVLWQFELQGCGRAGYSAHAGLSGSGLGLMIVAAALAQAFDQ